MLVRALLAFLALPGVVAFAVPLGWALSTERARLAQPLGLVPLLLGIAGLFWCVRDFYVAGKGTLVRQQFVRHLSDDENIGAPIDWLPCHPFGRHVNNGSD